MSKKYLLLFAGITCITTSAFARDNNHSGFYITGKVGASILQQKSQKYLEHYTISDVDTNEAIWSFNYLGKSGGTHSNARLGGGIAAGYNFDDHFQVPVRAEIDVMARMGDSSNYLRDHFSYPTYNNTAKYYQEEKINSKVQLNTFMFNGFYDFKNKSAFTPYLMGGIGLASMDQTGIHHITAILSDANTNDTLGNGWAKLRKNHTTNNFAWNAGAGVRYKINKDFDLDFSYRYLDAGKSSFTTFSGKSPFYTANTNVHERLKTRVVSQDIMLGLTYNF